MSTSRKQSLIAQGKTPKSLKLILTRCIDDYLQHNPEPQYKPATNNWKGRYTSFINTSKKIFDQKLTMHFSSRECASSYKETISAHQYGDINLAESLIGDLDNDNIPLAKFKSLQQYLLDGLCKYFGVTESSIKICVREMTRSYSKNAYYSPADIIQLRATLELVKIKLNEAKKQDCYLRHFRKLRLDETQIKVAMDLAGDNTPHVISLLITIQNSGYLTADVFNAIMNSISGNDTHSLNYLAHQ